MSFANCTHPERSKLMQAILAGTGSAMGAWALLALGHVGSFHSFSCTHTHTHIKETTR